MHFTAEQEALTRALGQVARVVAAQNTLPVLAGIQLQAEGDTLRVSATDLTTLLEAEIPVEVREPGVVVIPAATLHDLVHRIPTPAVEFHQADPQGPVTVRYGRNRATLHGFGAERLPAFPVPEGEPKALSLPPTAWAQAPQQLLFACARDDSRPILKGVSLTLGEGRAVLAATDGSRLSQSWFPAPEQLGAPVRAVLPARTVAELARLSAGYERLEVLVTDNLVLARVPGLTLTSRLLDGTFPDYERVIPREYLVTVRVPLADLRGAVERVHVITGRDHTASLRLHHQPGLLEVSASSPEYGQAFEEVECQSEGEAMDILFNPAYFLEALKSLDDGEAMLEFAGIHAAARFRSSAAPGYFHILLPLRQAV
ncbi:MAG: DNA polymerase III subunit beta [Firmicutes bacterium]|nr:DNA polymerase III subunit beta [Bacillota bacterium]